MKGLTSSQNNEQRNQSASGSAETSEQGPQPATNMSYQIPNMPPPTYEQATGTAAPPPTRFSDQQENFFYGTGTPAYRTGGPLPNEAPVLIIQQQAILPVPLGPDPVLLTCPACHMHKLTRIEYEPSAGTHLMAAVLCLVGLWCCFCLPYCAGSCMNTNHYCGHCNKFLGKYSGAV